MTEKPKAPTKPKTKRPLSAAVLKKIQARRGDPKALRALERLRRYGIMV